MSTVLISEEMVGIGIPACKTMQGWDALLERFNACCNGREIADMFEELEIKGSPNDASACAIAEFYKRYGGFHRLSVDEAISFYGTPSPEAKAEVHSLSRPMLLFMEDFDAELYPKLILK